jgi:hypothetical protein
MRHQRTPGRWVSTLCGWLIWWECILGCFLPHHH